MSPKVSVGLATYLGYGLGVLQLVLAGIAYANGQHETAYQLLATGNISNLVTAAGRYLQAHKQIATIVQHAEVLLPTIEEELGLPPLPAAAPAAPAEPVPVAVPDTAVTPEGAVPAEPPAGG